MHRPRRNNAGFTLVELMIAMVISLILLVAVLHIMLNNQNSLKTQHALAGLQSRARLLNVILDDSVASAGYHVDPTADPTNLFPATHHQKPNFKSGGFVAAIKNTYLRVRFQAAGSLHNCLGKPIGHFPSGKTATTTAVLKQAQQSDFALKFNSKHKSLYCKVYGKLGNSATPGNPGKHNKNKCKNPADHKAACRLISNIRVFKTRFGLDTKRNNGSANTFVSHLNPGQQSQVVSIRVQALLQTKRHVLSSPIKHRTYHFMDGTKFKVLNHPKSYRRAFLLFDRTVAVKNNIH